MEAEEGNIVLNRKNFWLLLKGAGSKWLDDKASRLGAALAYYTAFALAPLLLIAISVAGFIFGKDASRGQILGQVRGTVGDDAGMALQTMLASVDKPGSGILATVLGGVMLFVVAAGLFGELQDALNTVWEVQPKSGRGVWGFVKDRFLSICMVMATAVLALASFILSAVLAAFGGSLGDWAAGPFIHVVNFLVSFGLFTVLFAMIYRFLPDANIAWRDVWLGAAVTALLFEVGKLLIGLYLGYSAASSAYGAAGSLAVLLIWLYYSWQIFLFGAELTKAYASTFGSGFVPAPNAEAAKTGVCEVRHSEIETRLEKPSLSLK